MRSEARYRRHNADADDSPKLAAADRTNHWAATPMRSAGSPDGPAVKAREAMYPTPPTPSSASRRSSAENAWLRSLIRTSCSNASTLISPRVRLPCVLPAPDESPSLLIDDAPPSLAPSKKYSRFDPAAGARSDGAGFITRTRHPTDRKPSCSCRLQRSIAPRPRRPSQ